MFLPTVVENSAENGVVFCDLPNIPAGPVGNFIVHQMAAVAELEAGLISQRTKAALAVAKSRGTVLGGYKGGLVVPTPVLSERRPSRSALMLSPCASGR